RVRLGAYALGGRAAEGRQLVEDLLPGCAACGAELARLMPLPGLLAQVPGGMLGLRPPGQAAGRPGTVRARPARTWRAVIAAAVAHAAARVAGRGGHPHAPARRHPPPP